MHRVPGVGAGQGVDAFQAVGEGAHAQRQPPRRLGGDAPRVEVCGKGVDERLGTASGVLERTEGIADQVCHGLPVAGQDGVDKEVGGPQDGRVEFQAFGQVEGVEGLFVGLDDAARAGLGTADGDLRAVGGGVRLLGEEGEDFVLATGGDADQSAVLGGEQDAAVTEAADQRPLDLAGTASPSSYAEVPCATATACS